MASFLKGQINPRFTQQGSHTEKNFKSTQINTHRQENKTSKIIGEHRHANSDMSDHLDGCQVCKNKFSDSLFKILYFGRNGVEITIKEALYIKPHKPMLHRQSGQLFHFKYLLCQIVNLIVHVNTVKIEEMWYLFISNLSIWILFKID